MITTGGTSARKKSYTTVSDIGHFFCIAFQINRTNKMEKILENYSEKTYDPESTCGTGAEPKQIRGGTQSPGYPNTGRTVNKSRIPSFFYF